MKNKNFLPIVVFCLLLIGVGYYMYKDFYSQKESGSVAVEAIQEGENTQENKDKTGNRDVSVEIVGADEGSVASAKPSILVPNLERPVKIPENTPVKIRSFLFVNAINLHK